MRTTSLAFNSGKRLAITGLLAVSLSGLLGLAGCGSGDGSGGGGENETTTIVDPSDIPQDLEVASYFEAISGENFRGVLATVGVISKLTIFSNSVIESTKESLYDFTLFTNMPVMITASDLTAGTYEVSVDSRSEAISTVGDDFILTIEISSGGRILIQRIGS